MPRVAYIMSVGKINISLLFRPSVISRDLLDEVIFHDRTQRWRSVPFLQYNNKKCFIKFWAINKTEVQKIDVEVEVSGWLWLD